MLDLGGFNLPLKYVSSEDSPLSSSGFSLPSNNHTLLLSHACLDPVTFLNPLNSRYHRYDSKGDMLV